MNNRYFTERCKEVTELKNKGTEVYPKFTVTETFKGFLSKYSYLNNGEQSEQQESLAGRSLGKFKVANQTVYILYGGGLTVKACAKFENDASATMRVLHGDIVGVVGYPFKDKEGKISIRIKSIKILSLCLHNDVPTLPKPVAKSSPGSSTDTPKYLKPAVRGQKRYLDLLSSENVGVFQTRSKIISYVRKFFNDRDFLEVETSILEHIPGVGAGAPFATMFKGAKYYLRVAPEVKLKMLLVGGLERVFEIGKQFRNESLDATHHPEFTSCEAYMAFADYENMMTLTEDLLSGLVKDMTGGYVVELPAANLNEEPVRIDFKTPFRRLDILEELHRVGGLEIPADLCSKEANDYLIEACSRCGVQCKPPCRTARLLDKLVDHFLVPGCVNPTFIINHPKVMSVMAKSHQSRPEITERFELYINKQELCNSYSELNDPIEQRQRFSDLLEELAEGHYEATELDEAFCEALEYGLPPAAGWGIGVDRLVMLLTHSPAIKDVLLFPLQKAKKQKV